MSDNTEGPTTREAIEAILAALAAGVCPECGDPLHMETVEVETTLAAEFVEERPGVWRGHWACCGMVQYVNGDPRETIRPGEHKCLPDPATATPAQ